MRPHYFTNRSREFTYRHFVGQKDEMQNELLRESAGL